MNRLIRRIAALAAIAALAFAQLAVSAFACTGERPQAAQVAVDDAASPCHEAATPNLCERHCEYGASAAETQPLPASSAASFPAIALPWRVEPQRIAAPTRAASRPFERSLERPPLIRFTALRI